MEKYCFTSNKYAVRVTEGGLVREIPVYVTIVCDGRGNGKPLPPTIAAEFNGIKNGTHTTKTYFTTFEFEGEAELEIVMRDATSSVIVKPEVEGFVFENQRATLKVTDDLNFVVQPNANMFHALSVFCHKKRALVNDKANLMEFKAGVHTAQNSPYIENDEHGNPVIVGVRDDMLIYLHEGAFVCADLVLKGVKNVRVAGTGVLSTVHRCEGAERGFEGDTFWGGFRYYACPSLYIRSGCSDIVVEDITLSSEFRNVVIRNSQKIEIKNVKMFASTENADGINCYNTCELLVDGCFIWSSDDCFCMYNSCDSIPTLFDDGYEPVVAVCRDVEVKNCMMCSSSRPIVIGGHATGEKDPRCLIENLNIHDCYIFETPKRLFIGPASREMRWSGHLRILSQSEQIVRNLTFENIRIDYTNGCISKPVHIEVRGNKNASYTESRGYRIENITFRNITAGGYTDNLLPILIESRERTDENDDCGISGIVFDNFTVGGKSVDVAQMKISGPVDPITVR